MSEFDDYIQHLADVGIPSLGMLSWYSVPESCEILHSSFVELIVNNNAPINLMKPPRPDNVFKRACAKAQINKVSKSDGVFVNYNIRDAGYDDTYVYRQAVEEMVDGNSHHLGYNVIGDIMFNKKAIHLDFSALVEESSPSFAFFEQMTKSIQQYVHDKALAMNAYSIRESARRTLEGPLSATRVRPGGGIYFVSVSKSESLMALDSVINSVENASFHILPLIDDKKQRLMLKSAFQDESIGETQRLMAEIAEVLNSNGNVSAKTFLEFQSRYSQLKDKMTEYSTILDDALDQASNSLELCNTQITNLLNKMSS